MSAKIYRIVMPDGGVRGMTVEQVASESGISIQTIRNRLQKRGQRRWENLALSPDEGRRRGRQAFLRGTEATFAEVAEKRAAEAAHEEKVREGNQDL